MIRTTYFTYVNYPTKIWVEKKLSLMIFRKLNSNLLYPCTQSGFITWMVITSPYLRGSWWNCIHDLISLNSHLPMRMECLRRWRLTWSLFNDFVYIGVAFFNLGNEKFSLTEMDLVFEVFGLVLVGKDASFGLKSRDLLFGEV